MKEIRVSSIVARSRRNIVKSLAIILFSLLLNGPVADAADTLLLSEIMYHPVELPAFDSSGVPVLDLSEDVHEFVELYNAGTNGINLAGWKLTGGISFDFPSGATVGPGQFIVVAKNPVQLAAVAEYGLTTNEILGPYSGRLANDGDTVRVKNNLSQIVDDITYSPNFPWAIGANALGASDDWTGLNSADYQYRGRSLERVSYAWPASDPANWLASPLSTGPTPGRANSVQLVRPQTVVVALSLAQSSDGARLIRSNQPVRLDVTFSDTNLLASVSVEYFVDDVESTAEPRFAVALTNVGSPADAHFGCTLPGQSDRSVVRYRILADRGLGVEAVCPRPDDPFGWRAWFVTPQRTSANPIYDVFISTNSLNTLATNISQTPKRVTSPDPPGLLRQSWDATEPAIFVADGQVIDIRMRYHGSHYNRYASNKSYKYLFPRYARFNGRASYFETDKAAVQFYAPLLYNAANLPIWRARYTDIYQNRDARLTRLEMEDFDRDLYARWATEQALKFPGITQEDIGDFWKAEGDLPFETGLGNGTASSYETSGEGPIYITSEPPMAPKAGWTLLERYNQSYHIRVDGWRGGLDVQQLIEGLWAARGDYPTRPSPNIAATRAFLQANFDVDAMLTYMAIRDWSAPWDDAFQNHFLWRKADGRWGMLMWDADAEFNYTSRSIFWDEQTVPQGDTLRGPNWIKDSFYKSFRAEHKQKMFVLNHTLLTPANLSAIGASGLVSFAAARQANVDAQLGLGSWYAPLAPTNVAPVSGSAAFLGTSLIASAYTHSDPAVPPQATTTWLLRPATGAYTAPILRVTSATNLTSLPIPFNQLVFGQTYYWKCFYTDVNSHPSPESVETPFVFGGAAVPGAVRLNEVLANNKGSVANGNQFPDYIELFNNSGQTQNIAAFSLTDNLLSPGKYFFPSGTTIAPYGFLTVWCDDATNSPGLHSGFAINKDGQTVALFVVTTNGYTLADSVSLGLQIPDASVGRIAGSWGLNTPTPNATNMPAALGSPTSLKINEWMASSSTGPDWFELFNPEPLPVALGGLYLANFPSALTNPPVPGLSFVAGRGFRKFIADKDLDQGPRHVNFKLSASGDSICLANTNLVVIDTVNFGPQTTDISQGRLLDGSNNIVSFPATASPEAPNYLPLTSIVINEVLSHAHPPLEDSIELVNVSNVSVNLINWWLSDSLDNLRKFQITTNGVLASGAFLVLYQSQFGNTNSPTAFALSSTHCDKVYLSAADAAGNLTGQRTGVSFGPADSNVSFGRVPTSLGFDFWAQAARTPGAVNSGPLVGSVVISEIQYHPPLVPGNDDDYEYLRLQNFTATNVPLYHPAFPTNTWRLQNAVEFSFPTNITLAPGGSLLVVGFDPAANPTMLNDFRGLYGIDETLPVFGPYSGHLDNAGETVELAKPYDPWNRPGPDFGFVPYPLVDSVSYAATPPWPAGADGTGLSLHRLNLAGYGNEPTNWVAGASAVTNARPTVFITGPRNSTVFGANQPIPISAYAADSDGFVQRVEFFVDDVKVGQAAMPFSFVWSNTAVGTHKLVARAVDNQLGATDSGPVFVDVINFPPTVAITSPTNSAIFTLPANVVIDTGVSDPDGSVAQVDFYATGIYLGSAYAPPFRYNWVNPPAGTYLLVATATDALGARTDSVQVSVTVRTLPIVTNSTVAYDVNAGTVGSTPFNGGLGMDFDAMTNVLVTRLGAFDSVGDGINGSATLTVQIYARNGNSGSVLGSLSFTAADPGVLVGGSRFKPLPVALALPKGAYSIVTYGHDSANPAGDAGSVTKTWSTNDAGGLVSFVGSARFGSGGPSNFPAAIDGGPADRYAAGTFEFRSPLVAPTGLTAVAANRRVVLSWTGVGGATSYNAKRSAASGGPFTAFTNLTRLNCTDSGLVNGITYYYVVSAAIANSESPDSSLVSATPSATNKLAGTIIGTAGSWNNQGNTKEKAMDGSLSTFFDAPAANGCWVGLDLGTNIDFLLTAIRYCPRNNFADRMLNGKFQGANSADFSYAVDLFIITNTPPYDTLTAQSVSASNIFRYVRYLSPDGGSCNIAELEFYGIEAPAPAPPAGLTAAAGAAQVSLTWARAAFATSYRIKRATTSGGPYANVGTTSATTYTDTGLANGTTCYYVVSSVNSSGESANSAQVGATPFSGSVAYRNALSALNPVGYWRLNETSDTNAADYFGLHNGTYGANSARGLPGPQPPSAPGFEPTNKAVCFTNGVNNSYVVLPPLNLNTNTATITAWAYPLGSIASYSGLVFCRNGSDASGLCYTTNNFLGYTWNTNSSATWSYKSGLIVPQNQWSFVALVVAPTRAILYLYSSNSLFSATNAIAYTTEAFSGLTLIGDDATSSSRVFGGLMDEVAIFNYALTETQLQQLYASAYTAPPPAPHGIAASAWTGQVGLRWTPSSGATNYYVKRSLTSGGAYALLATTAATNYTDLAVTNNTTYYYDYVVSAVGAAGESADTPEVSAAPRPPPVLTAGLGGSNQLVLAWPGWATAYAAYGASNLLPPIQWRLLTNTAISSNGMWILSLPMTADTQFFRLAP
jgi:fibronectin type 3 domain-containing protein